MFSFPVLPLVSALILLNTMGRLSTDLHKHTRIYMYIYFKVTRHRTLYKHAIQISFAEAAKERTMANEKGKEFLKLHNPLP